MFDTSTSDASTSHTTTSAPQANAGLEANTDRPAQLRHDHRADPDVGAEGKGTAMFATLNDECFTDDWWDLAACRDGEGSLARVFFSEELQDIARAKEICSTCPAMVPCLEGAAARREPWGVWGGQLFLNGRVLATKRRRGRPPKIPRPEDQLPDIPIPVELQAKVRLRAS